MLKLKQCSSSCLLETAWVYAHAGISATYGGIPLFGVENGASHLSVSCTTLEKNYAELEYWYGNARMAGKDSVGQLRRRCILHQPHAEGVAGRKT